MAITMAWSLAGCGESSSSQSEKESSSQAAQSEKGTDGGVTTVSDQTMNEQPDGMEEPNQDIDDGADISEQTTTATTTAMTTTATEATTSDSTTKTTTTTKATTKAKPVTTVAAKTQKKIIPATQLARMTTAQLKAVIGNNYRAGKEGDHFGVTSDYFPHVFLVYNGLNDADSIKGAFDEGHNYISINVLPGGLIGDNAYVGDTFKGLLTKIECLGAIEIWGDYNYSQSVVDGQSVRLSFDNQKQLSALKDKQGRYIDASAINCKSTHASLTVGFKYNGKYGKKATVTVNNQPIYLICSENSPVIWNVKKGETVWVGESMSGARGPVWCAVNLYSPDGKKSKIGFMRAETLKYL